MAKRGHSHRPGSSTRRRRIQHQARDSDLITTVGQLLAVGDPFDFLCYVSALLASLDQSPQPFQRTQPGVTLPALLDSFAEVKLPQTTALLAGIAELAPDELNRARARRALATRSHPLPGWLTRLRETSVYRAVELGHVLGDGDNVMLGVRLPGFELTMVIYIDHNLGTVVKDGFAVPAPLDEVIGDFLELGDDPDTTYRDLSLADARARADQAIELGMIMFPPLETDTWPGSRPLARWLLRILPEGGSGYQRPEWDQAATRRLAKQFFASDHGSQLNDADHKYLLDQILWFGTGYGPGDPLRWSPVAVEILLADWIPRKLVASPACLAKAPDLLRAFIGFCHAERGIRPVLTGQTLAAVNHHEPAYQRVIRSPRAQGPMALLAAMGMVGADQPGQPEGGFLDHLAACVGGHEALDALDDKPLPDEEFSWDGVPADVREPVACVLAACDRCSDELLGDEYRTACRRLLARAVPGMAKTLRGGSKPEAIAAGVLWVIGTGNERFGRQSDSLRIKDVVGYLGLGQASPAQRGAQIMRAAGIQALDTYGRCHLGSPDLLVSARRRRIIELRDRVP
jgi:hypothetical protein